MHLLDNVVIHKMSISEADDCGHDEAAKLILENSPDDHVKNRKKSKERKSVRISDEEITFYPLDDSGYTTCKGEYSLLSEKLGEDNTILKTVEEWTEEVFGNDSVLQNVNIPGHETILKNKSESKVTFCDTPKAAEQSDITYSEILILDSPPSGHKPIKRSASLESRDNPFIPGGSLDKEAEDILKRATIIRDQFILSDSQIKLEENSTTENTENSEVHNTCYDLSTEVTEETIFRENLNSTQTLLEPKQNGKLEEKLISTDSPHVDTNQKDGQLDRPIKDKKKQKKCCSLM